MATAAVDALSDHLRRLFCLTDKQQQQLMDEQCRPLSTANVPQSIAARVFVPDASVRIVNLEAAQQYNNLSPRIGCIRAFNMEWRPVLRPAQAVPGGASTDQSRLITFYSVETALLDRPSPELLSHQQRMAQLPAAVMSNAAAMKTAEASGELSDVGALFLEGKKLQAELAKLQADSPPGREILEVRDTMQLPLGPVCVDGRCYFILDAKQQWQRETMITPLGQAAAINISAASLPPDSKILTLQHLTNLAKMFAPTALPGLQLMWSGERDGFTPQAFHTRCDQKGATLTVIRSGEYVFGAYHPYPWLPENYRRGMFYSSDIFLFSLRSPTGLLTKLVPQHEYSTETAQTARGPCFGQDIIINLENSAGTRASPSGTFKPALGFSGATYNDTTLAGKQNFTVDQIEIFQCLRAQRDC